MPPCPPPRCASPCEPSTRLADELVELRRDLHAHPELAWQEHRTTAVVAERLDRGRARTSQLLPKTGLVAEVGADAGEPAASRCGPTSTRCPVDDRGGDPWASTVDGVAHACGHDVHTAALLGAGLALAELHRTARRCPAGSGCCSSRPRRSCPAARSR